MNSIPAIPLLPEHELFKPIGRGSYGEVWLARTITGQWRAVKIVRRENFEEAKSYDREFAGVSHYSGIAMQQPGLVQMYLVGRNDAEGFFYYTMELADDVGSGQDVEPTSYSPRTLASRLHTIGTLTVGQALLLGEQLALALDHLHSHGLLHRDVKPANIVYVQGQAKLADPGLMSLVDMTASNGTVSTVGTHGYVPMDGAGTPAADLFAVGKVLHEALSGKDCMSFPEFDAPNEALRAINPVLHKACAPDAASRYQRASDLAQDLTTVRTGQATLHIDEDGKISYAMTSRRKWMIAGSTAAVATLIAGTVWWQRNDRRAKAQRAAVKLPDPATKPPAVIATNPPPVKTEPEAISFLPIMPGYARLGAAHAMDAAKKDTAIRYEWGQWEPEWTAPGKYKDTAGMAMGHNHTVCLCADGTVAAHGFNSDKQCDVPKGLDSVVAVAAGELHSLAMTATGRVVPWGFEVVIDAGKWITDAVAIAAGGLHNLVLRANGQIVTWGRVDSGQCTLPNFDGRRARAIAAGRYHSVALMADDTVVCWGAGSSETITGMHLRQSMVPKKLENVQAIAAGDFHTVALCMDGSLVIWGDPAAEQCKIPVGLGLVEAIAVGANHNVVLQRDGQLRIWGDNNFKQLATPGAVQAQLMSSSANLLQICAGGNRSAALMKG